MMSKPAKDFISKKVKKNVEEGYPPKQAVAIAYSQARKEGYNVPKVPMRHKKIRRL